MRISFIGLGKLGTPVATAIAYMGHEVCGYDPSAHVREAYEAGRWPHREGWPGGRGDFNEFFATDRPRMCASVEEAVRDADIVFVAVQTPHHPKLGGAVPTYGVRADFDYTALREACADVGRHRPGGLVVVISTVLPGTMRREIEPVLAGCRFAYSPQFIAMGNVVADYLEPEFFLIGVRDDADGDYLAMFYATIADAPTRRMSVESAELAKVAYNTFISAKIGIVNLLGEVCHKTPGADVDDVSLALTSATRRVCSPQYMSAGMGDGGSCHPRDGLAMSWLAERLALHADLFGVLMSAREQHASWLAGLLIDAGKSRGLPLGIMGYAYKPGVGLTDGSPALLVKSFIPEPCVAWDPYVDGDERLPNEPRAWLVGCRHEQFARVPESWFAPGSVVVDPFRYLPDDLAGITVIPVGAGR